MNAKGYERGDEESEERMISRQVQGEEEENYDTKEYEEEKSEYLIE